MTKIKDLKDIKLTLGKMVVRSFLAVGLAFGFLGGIFLFKYLQYQEEEGRKEILSTNQIFQSDISQQLAIIASSMTFTDFIRSGESTRKKMMVGLLNELSNLKVPAIIGMEIFSKDKMIFESGKNSPYKTILELCYVGASLDDRYGNCYNTWIIFMDKNAYIQGLKKYNNSIKLCEQGSCPVTHLLNESKFGTFSVAAYRDFDVALGAYKKNNYAFYFACIIVILALIVLAVWNRYRIRSTVEHYLTRPLNDLTTNLKLSRPLLDTENEIKEIDYLKKQIEGFKKNEHIAKIGEMAAQVAHDIRSPLVALSMAADSLNGINEESRIFIRNAVLRIHDIANNLLNKNKHINEKAKCLKEINTLFLSPIVEAVLSEKRLQYGSRIGISLNTVFTEQVYNIFVNVNIQELKRVLSNLIDNAIEAVGDEGNISIKLIEENNHAILSIQDNGVGISKELLTKLGQRGVTFGKFSGSGLGLYHAFKTVHSWKGNIIIDSIENEGTEVKIVFPLAKSPVWFKEKLFLNEKTMVLVLDDDISIHDVWDRRFQSVHLKEKEFTVLHFYSYEQVSDWLQRNQAKNYQFLLLFDYELLGTPGSGLDLLEKLKGLGVPILVTSRYEEEKIQVRCQAEEIFLLPKSMAAYIPISWA